jgi:polysaccharide pyruvyl transferase WcaK-like protein
MKPIAVCGEIYSANLGDQAIHACLLHLLERFQPGIETVSLDLSGRQGGPAAATGGPGLRQRIAAWQSRPVLSAAYGLINLTYLSYRLKRLQAGPWGRSLASAHALVIGGGQLLMDDGLNFPLKVAGAARLARRLGIPYHISACGVGRSWSPLGTRLFAGALRPSASITLRDHLSASRLAKMLPDLQPQVTFDPAIWAAEVYPLQPAAPAAAIGLGVIDMDSYNARTEDKYDPGAWLESWVDLLAALHKGQGGVLLFTTGSPGDEQFAARLHAEAGRRGLSMVTLAPRPHQVPDLMRTLQSCQVVVATRLHAAILANACSVDTIGIAWDEKVRAYYGETARPDQCFPLTQPGITEMALAAHAIMGQPFPGAALQELRGRALESARVVLSEYRSGSPG